MEVQSSVEKYVQRHIGVASTSRLGGPHIVKDEMQSWASAEHAKLGCAPLGKLDSDIEF